MSLCFLLLTAFVFPICFFAACYSVQKNLELFLLLLLSIEILLILSFICLDVLFFYVFFESILIPMFLMIGLWGSRARKIKAAYYFFLYTFFGSLFMLFGILYIYLCCGSTSYLDVFHSDIFSPAQQIIL
jgi:NADH-ubiquinone oxidoreductase chain 4